MGRDEFERRVLELWMQTRIPLTRAHLQYDTGLKRRQLESWLDEMVVEGILDFEVSESGEMTWTVTGAERPPDGPASFSELEKRGKRRAEAKTRLRRKAGRPEQGGDHGAPGEIELASRALSLATSARGSLEEQRGDGKKSVLLSAGLSFFGPLGWLYAAPFRESLPAVGAMMLLWAIVPSFLLAPLLFLAMPLSSLAGLVYAWQYNRYGHRTPIFLSSGEEESGT